MVGDPTEFIVGITNSNDRPYAGIPRTICSGLAPTISHFSTALY